MKIISGETYTSLHKKTVKMGGIFIKEKSKSVGEPDFGRLVDPPAVEEAALDVAEGLRDGEHVGVGALDSKIFFS